jgi:hypothetical protein
MKKLPAELIQTLISSQLYGINHYILTAKPSAPARKKLVEESFEMVWGMIAN